MTQDNMVTSADSLPTAATAIFASGCFWCTEAVFGAVRGVSKAESGYIGGHVAQPSYKQVCGGDTGHAEAVRVTYDPKVISYGELLGIFFATHDPTQLNRQGNDIGTQYRSAIFYDKETEKQAAESYIQELEQKNIFDGPIVTQLEPASTFYPAEDYHQDYFAQNPAQPYCMAVVAPKVVKFRKQFESYLKQ